MNARSLTTAVSAFVLLATACHKTTPPVVQPGAGGQTPPPQTTPVLPPPPPPVVPPPPPPPGPTTDRAPLLATISDKIHFDFDMFDIKSEDMARLDRKAAIMRVNPNLKIRIIGNCDERGSDSYNIALGMKRATAAKEYLIKAGANGNNIEVASLGRESPEDPAGTEDAIRKNRRDEFEVTAGGQTIVAPRP